MRSDWAAGFTEALGIRCIVIGLEYEANGGFEEHSHESPVRRKTRMRSVDPESSQNFRSGASDRMRLIGFLSATRGKRIAGCEPSEISNHCGSAKIENQAFADPGGWYVRYTVQYHSSEHSHVSLQIASLFFCYYETRALASA
jgi:hypothetical protein